MNEIRNVPGLWTSLFHWISYMFFIAFLPKKAKGPLIAFISAVILLIQTTLYITFVADRTGPYFNIANSLFALWTLVPFLLFTSGSFSNKVYYCARAFILGAFFVSLGWQFYSFNFSKIPGMAGFGGECLFMALIAVFSIAVIYTAERWNLKVDQEMNVTPIAAAGVLVIALATYVLSSLSYAFQGVPFTAARDAEIYSIRSLTYFGGVAILFAVHLQLCEVYTQNERHALQSVLDTQYRNYRAMQDSISIVNQKYHDMKHQIALLRSELGNEKKLEYLDQVESEISAYEAQNKTGNEVLDTILTGKSQQCYANHISFTCVADGHALDFLSVMDMSAIFGNALDNAIESVMKIENPEERLIHLSVSMQRQFVSIILRNRYKDEPVMHEGLPQTTKKEKALHGYGVKSIKSTVEKHGGAASVGTRDGWFELSILMPAAQKGKR